MSNSYEFIAENALVVPESSARADSIVSKVLDKAEVLKMRIDPD
jgi:hypothetical protein